MRTSPVALVVALVVLTGLAATPRVVVAGDRPQPRGGTIVVGPVVPHPSVHPFVHPSVHPFVRPFGSPPFFPRQFAPFVVASPPVVVSAPPTVLFTPPPVVYLQPPAVMTVTPPPPTPLVLEYPNGRYELRGDGITTPYRWAWIPKPPPPPPAPPETLPTVPPAPPSDVPADPPSTEQQPPAHRPEIYRWTDERGLTTWTDRIDKVPEQYRAQTQRMM